MPRSAPTLDATYFRHGARDRAFAQVVRVRLLAAPVLAAVALTFAFFEPTFWRRALLAGVVCMLLTVSVIEWLRYRRLGLRAFMLPLNLIAMSAGQACIALATGGLFSPVIPALFLVVVLGAVLAERGAILAMIALVQIPATWAMAVAHVSSAPVETLVPELFGGAGALEDGPAPWIAATVYTAMFVASARIGAYVRGIFEELFTEAMQERDRSLALHAEQNRALTQLSGEIAHELKNPLASVKGLALARGQGARGKARRAHGGAPARGGSHAGDPRRVPELLATAGAAGALGGGPRAGRARRGAAARGDDGGARRLAGGGGRGGGVAALRSAQGASGAHQPRAERARREPARR
ncbi:MAG: hypothetical protein M5U28_18575 [Sandaracinaceae bacterium]|nr:hypothetical protein [Sandaracinaceae bacterium]